MEASTSTLCAAIAGRRMLCFTYHGAERVVEPHAHGFTADGAEILSAYQTDGCSNSGPVPGWRTFRVANMGPVDDTGIVFLRARPDYNATRICRLCCRL